MPSSTGSSSSHGPRVRLTTSTQFSGRHSSRRSGTTSGAAYWQLARDALFHTVLKPGTKPAAIYLMSMPWALTAREADTLLESCSHWAGEAFGCGAYLPAKHGQLGAKADSETRLKTLLAMASVATNTRFLRALPNTPQWLKALTLAVGGYLPASAITPII